MAFTHFVASKSKVSNSNWEASLKQKVLTFWFIRAN